ncbi:hypothetical protein M378DRAFT_169916 [Amanita muscaria Koide BX008]|uniref:Uncharacterized protein n=1 Tax=Amanita muscaria (strain Koide BX008) TaxID=946122 RepID=A0A0C2S8F9_AMAMK|nr:hypothetical protein M378DRAFT_169916 [Amanita muscaria Koide BX008]
MSEVLITVDRNLERALELANVDVLRKKLERQAETSDKVLADYLSAVRQGVPGALRWWIRSVCLASRSRRRFRFELLLY